MSGLWNTFVAHADATASAPALVFGDRTISFGELHLTALRYAAALAARGVARGHVVALQIAKCQLKLWPAACVSAAWHPLCVF